MSDATLSGLLLAMIESSNDKEKLADGLSKFIEREKRDAQLGLIERLRMDKIASPHIGIGHLHEAEIEAVYNFALSDFNAKLDAEKSRLQEGVE